VSATKLPQSAASVNGGQRDPLSSLAYFDARFKATHQPAKTDWTKTANWNGKRVSPAHNRRLRHASPVKVEVYADMVKVSIPDDRNGKQPRSAAGGASVLEKPMHPFGGVIGLNLPRQSGGVRSAVAGFSRSSRKRMIEFMAKVRHTGSMLFLTMTYDDISLIREDLDLKAEFEAFRRRFERAFPTWAALWRIELQERKSGIHQGKLVPHYHLLVFTEEKYEDGYLQSIADSFRSWGAVAWQEITTSYEPSHLVYGFHVTPVRSRKQAYAYVSKYVGKAANDNYEIGRRWGRIGRFDTTSSETFTLDDQEHIALRRLIKRWLKNKKPEFGRKFGRMKISVGFSVFGLGDGLMDASDLNIFSGISQFIVEVKRQSLERQIRESTHFS